MSDCGAVPSATEVSKRGARSLRPPWSLLTLYDSFTQPRHANNRKLLYWPGYANNCELLDWITAFCACCSSKFSGENRSSVACRANPNGGKSKQTNASMVTVKSIQFRCRSCASHQTEIMAAKFQALL
jgi:hypothetical protein